MLEIFTGGLITIPASLFTLTTSGYIDASVFMQLQACQSHLFSMIGESVVGALSPARMMYNEDLGSFIYVSEVLGE